MDAQESKQGICKGCLITCTSARGSASRRGKLVGGSGTELSDVASAMSARSGATFQVCGSEAAFEEDEGILGILREFAS